MIKASNPTDVRFYKYVRTFVANGFDVEIICWERNNFDFEKEDKLLKNVKIKYIIKGFNTGKLKVVGYLLWYFSIYRKLLFSKKRNFYYCADFEAAFPCFLLKKIKKLRYVYDIYDEFALRYNFNKVLRKTIFAVDRKIRKASIITIHVDPSRVSALDKNYIIIPNVPFDFYNGKFETPDYKKKIAITGWLAKSRGVESIYKFARDNSSIEFLIIGEIDPALREMFSSMPNVIVLTQMRQDDLFKVIFDVSAIIALYNPEIEINRKAAPNKLYDAMMLGIPIVTNKGIEVADFIQSNNLGLVVNYGYDGTWKKILDLISDKEAVRDMGEKSRSAFEAGFNFSKCVETGLINKLMDTITQPI
jgi:glycosyltransferase involved in cell wall biosynthesis